MLTVPTSQRTSFFDIRAPKPWLKLLLRFRPPNGGALLASSNCRYGCNDCSSRSTDGKVDETVSPRLTRKIFAKRNRKKNTHETTIEICSVAFSGTNNLPCQPWGFCVITAWITPAASLTWNQWEKKRRRDRKVVVFFRESTRVIEKQKQNKKLVPIMLSNQVYSTVVR